MISSASMGTRLKPLFWWIKPQGIVEDAVLLIIGH